MSNPAIKPNENQLKTLGDIANVFAILLDYRISISNQYDKVSKNNFNLMCSIENILTAACKAFNLPPCKVECVDYDTVRFKKFKSEEYSYVTESFINNCYPGIKWEFDKAKEPLKIYNDSADKFMEICEDCFFSMFAAICKTCFLIIRNEKNIPFDEIVNYFNDQSKRNIDNPKTILRNTCNHFVFYNSNLLQNVELSEKVYDKLIDYLMQTQNNPKKVSLFTYFLDFFPSMLDFIDDVIYKLYKYLSTYFENEMVLFEIAQSYLVKMGYNQMTIGSVKNYIKKY